MAYKIIGNTVAEWDDNEPFIFTLSEEVGEKDERIKKTTSCDLSVLRTGFEDESLLHLKDIIIERSNKVVLGTCQNEVMNLTVLLRRTIEHKLFNKKITHIDESFLLALTTIKGSLSAVNLKTLKKIFNACPDSPIFAPGLRSDDFPLHSNKKGYVGLRIENILAKALTRAACCEILTHYEQAYEDGQIDIGRYSFIKLAFNVYARSESYRQIRLEDLVYDTKEDAFFLYIMPAKSKVHQPQKISYRINKHVGELLQKQRQHVKKTYGHLVDPKDINKIALFPASQITKDKSRWSAKHANESFGQIEVGGTFTATYFKQVLPKLKIKTNANALRHTVGTQMAQSGASSKTIAAILKHASDKACGAYVDIAFHGLMNELSDAMRPTFEAHMPVFQRFRSTGDSIQPDKAIYSEDIEIGRTELTGECGKQIRCQAAPFTCYECNKFIPCWDADHSVNLGIMGREIEEYRNAGTAFRQMMEKARTLKIRIELIMAACTRYQQTLSDQNDL